MFALIHVVILPFSYFEIVLNFGFGLTIISIITNIVTSNLF